MVLSPFVREDNDASMLFECHAPYPLVLYGTYNTVSAPSKQDEIEDLTDKSLEPVTLPSVKRERERSASKKSESSRGLLTAITGLLIPR